MEKPLMDDPTAPKGDGSKWEEKVGRRNEKK